VRVTVVARCTVSSASGAVLRPIRPRKEKSLGCGTRGSPWSGGAPVGRLRKVFGSAAQPILLVQSPLALPLHSTWRPAVVQGALTLGAFLDTVK